MFEVNFNNGSKQINIAKQVTRYNKTYDSKIKTVDVIISAGVGIAVTFGLMMGAVIEDTTALISIVTTPIASCGIIKGCKLIKERIIKNEKKEIISSLESVSSELANSNINTNAINIAESVIFTEVKKTSNLHKVDDVETTVEEATSDTYCIFLDEKDRVQGILERESYTKPANASGYEKTTQQFVLERYDISPFQKQVSKKLVKRLTKGNE